MCVLQQRMGDLNWVEPHMKSIQIHRWQSAYCRYMGLELPYYSDHKNFINLYLLYGYTKRAIEREIENERKAYSQINVSQYVLLKLFLNVVQCWENRNKCLAGSIANTTAHLTNEFEVHRANKCESHNSYKCIQNRRMNTNTWHIILVMRIEYTFVAQQTFCFV